VLCIKHIKYPILCNSKDDDDDDDEANESTQRANVNPVWIRSLDSRSQSRLQILMISKL